MPFSLASELNCSIRLRFICEVSKYSSISLLALSAASYTEFSTISIKSKPALWLKENTYNITNRVTKFYILNWSLFIKHVHETILTYIDIIP